jgi:GNAT superfamily N-acetyltransferase
MPRSWTPGSVSIRPARPADERALREYFDTTLTPEDRYLRFFMGGTVRPGLIRTVTSSRVPAGEWLVATIRVRAEKPGYRILAEASWARSSRDDPGIAELGISDAPNWRSLGLASALLAEVATRAANNRVHTFKASVLADNDQALRWLLGMGANAITRDTVSVDFRLPADALLARYRRSRGRRTGSRRWSRGARCGVRPNERAPSGPPG